MRVFAIALTMCEFMIEDDSYLIARHIFTTTGNGYQNQCLNWCDAAILHFFFN